MAKPETQFRDVISIGPFSLAARERLLTRDGAPVELGARTLDTLIALASRPNEVVSKRQLMAAVWPDVIVEEGSLRFHIASLRKALGDGKDGARYITTLAGRGYCFVAPILVSSAKVATTFSGATFLPARLTRMVGRADTVPMISRQLAASRFVTIVGPGGVGKTTVAVMVAHDLLESFDGSVLFVDLGMLNDPNMVPASVASMLGIPIHSDDPTPGLTAYLRDKRMILILDNCEHVIDAVANLTALIFPAASQLHILATSREALRVEGEQVHKLMPLGYPPDDPGLTARQQVELDGPSAIAKPRFKFSIEPVEAHDLADTPKVRRYQARRRKISGSVVTITAHRAPSTSEALMPYARAHTSRAVRCSIP